jgi:hypothetical protein
MICKRTWASPETGLIQRVIENQPYPERGII